MPTTRNLGVHVWRRSCRALDRLQGNVRARGDVWHAPDVGLRADLSDRYPYKAREGAADQEVKASQGTRPSRFKSVRRAKPAGDVRRTPHFPWPFTAMSTAVEDSKDATSTTFEWKPGTYLPNPEARMLNALENAEYENVLERIVDTDKVECVRPCVPRCPRPRYLQDRVAAPVRYYQIQDLKSRFLEISCVPRSHCPIEHGRIP
jgi:hypothetical protein